MPSAGFETATPATKRPQTYALDRAATEVGIKKPKLFKMYKIIKIFGILFRFEILQYFDITDKIRFGFG
jgi:hypothetical protein